MKLLIVPLVLAVALGASACGDDGPKVTQGTVVAKSYEPPSTGIMPSVVPCGKVTCTIMIPYSRPAKWSIRLEDCTFDCVQDNMPVDETTYNDLEVGDIWPRTAPAVPR